jgi:hypothetical protein
LTACGVSPTASSAPVVTPQLVPTASATSQLPLATAILQTTPQVTSEESQNMALQEVLKNSTFTSPNYNKTVTLRDGKYESGTGTDYLLVQLLPQMAFGDFNQDGKNEAAVLIGENGGGSGVFVSLIALTFKNNNPTQVGSALVDDRPKIHALSIKNGQIILEATIHGPADAMVNPTLPVIETYQFISNQMVLVNLATKTPDGQDRTINISSPTDQTAVKGSIKVQGTMPIAPFENNLAYRIYDAKGSEVGKGPFPVKASKPGGKAAFDNMIKIPPLAAGTIIRLELSDISMKDGSNLAMASVNLVMK